MRTDLLDYVLPEEQIARFPTQSRDGARMLAVESTGYTDSTIAEWPSLLPPGALVVLNDTKVFKARLLGHRRPTGGKVELLLLDAPGHGSNHDGRGLWRAIGRSNRPLSIGMTADFGAIEARIVERDPDGELRVELHSDEPIEAALERVGHVPIPPYLGREDDASDVERYQTVYARHSGSIAAPTAGLHLSEGSIEMLRRRDIDIAYATLHVGIGTFRPVVADDIDQHDMHSERFEVTQALARAVEAARLRDAPVIAVGTTVVRALESAADPERAGYVIAQSGETRLLVQPGYGLRVADSLLTNFHMPKSTLLALVGAFVGLERLMQAYAVALERKYRFLSYGDAMWIAHRV